MSSSSSAVHTSDATRASGEADAEVADMVVNERHYQQTRRDLAELDDLITAVEAGSAGDEFRDVQLAGLPNQVEDLRREISEYETQILDAARRGELGEKRDAEFIRSHAVRLREDS